MGDFVYYIAVQNICNRGAGVLFDNARVTQYSMVPGNRYYRYRSTAPIFHIKKKKVTRTA